MAKVRRAAGWLEPYRRIWQDRFKRLDSLLKEMQKKERKHGKN
jgi:hypothetical protein